MRIEYPRIIPEIKCQYIFLFLINIYVLSKSKRVHNGSDKSNKDCPIVIGIKSQINAPTMADFLCDLWKRII